MSQQTLPAIPFTPYYDHNGITIYNCDCRQVLPFLPKFDCMIADPPYAIRNNFGKQSRKDGTRTLQFAWDGAGVLEATVEAIELCGDLVSSFFTFCGVSQVSKFEEALESKFTVKPAVWIKACPPPAMPGNWWPSGFELALYGYTSGAWFDDKCAKRKNVFYTDTYRAGIRADEKVDHPTQKWLPLMREIVSAIVPDNGSCIDPFMGSGTTLVAAKLEGRRAVGIEISERYCEAAANRLSQEVLFR